MLCGANNRVLPFASFLKDRSDSKFLVEQYPWNSHKGTNTSKGKDFCLGGVSQDQSHSYKEIKSKSSLDVTIESLALS